MDALVKAVAALAAARTVDEVTAVVRSSARSLTGADGVTFVVREGAQVYYADEDAISPLWKGRRFPIEQCISGLAMLQREAIQIPDVYEDDRIPIEAYRPTFVRSLLMTPIGHDEPIAAIGTYWASVREATLQERLKVQALAEAAALAFRNMRLARELDEMNRRFDVLANASPVLLWLNGADGNQYVNRAYLEFVGVPAEELRGMGWQRFVHPDDLEAYASGYLEAVRRGEPWEATFRFRRHDNEWRWMHSRGQPVVDERGEVTSYAGSSQDVTELIAAQQALREADRRKDEFLATLAHELRNPLAPIRNATQLLKLSDTADPQVKTARGMIDRQVQHMVRLVDDLMEVSRITLGQITLQSEHIDLRDVLSGAIESVATLIEASGHRMAVTMPPEPVPVHGDGVRLSQVFQNLLNNACKYTPRGGNIDLRLEVSHVEALVEVCDDGVGIPAEMQSRVFDLFTRIHPTDEIRSSGLGIGLALSRRLTELHGGRIDVQSDGKGSRFRVRLPLDHAARLNPEPAVRERSEATRRKNGRGQTVLVVDDNCDAAESLSMLLQLDGYEVFTAFDGMGAIEQYEAVCPDIVLLDIGMPRLDGYEVARRIRGTSAGKRALLVAMTGWGQEKTASARAWRASMST